MTGLDRTLGGSSFGEALSLGFDEAFSIELLRISIVPLTLSLEGERGRKLPLISINRIGDSDLTVRFKRYAKVPMARRFSCEVRNAQYQRALSLRAGSSWRRTNIFCHSCPKIDPERRWG